MLIPRPRGWHLHEKHATLDGEPVSASFFDFGLYVFHNAKELAATGEGPFFYLPKMESHLEARLWNDVFSFAQEELGLDPGTIKATVLIETLPAAFEMEEILYELRDHSAGLNAGRWDYIFSAIKYFRERPEYVLPDRSAVTMTVPFMRAYTELLVRTCHRRGAHAMGGMAAQIPSRTDPEGAEKANEAVTQGQAARGRRRLRRHVGRAPRRGRRGQGAVRRRARARTRTRSRRSARTSRSAATTSSTSARRRATSPRRACAPT